PMLPDVPSLSEAAGLPGLEESSTWIALAAPVGTPGTIIDRLHREITHIYADPVMVARFQSAGIVPEASATPAELVAFIRSEAARWSKVLKVSGDIKLD